MLLKNHSKMMLISFLMPVVSFILFSLIKGTPFQIITPDGELYRNLAGNFLNGKGLVNTIREQNVIVPPAYPLLIASIIYLFKDITYVFLFQFIILGFTGVLLYVFAYTLFKSRLAAILSLAMLSLHPVFLNNGPTKLLTETIFTFITLAVALLGTIVLNLSKEDNRDRLTGWTVVFILLFFVSLLFRPHLLFLIPFVVGYTGWLVFKKKVPGYVLLISLVVPAVLLGGNMLYNKSVQGHAVMFENYSGMNLYIANNPETSVRFFTSTSVDKFVGKEYYRYKDTDLSEKSAILKEKAVDYILDEPLAFVERLVKKTGLFFSGISRYDTALTLLFMAGYGLAWLRLKEQRVILAIIGLYILYFAVLSSVGLLVSSQRYRLPIIPVYIVFSSFMLYSPVSWIVQKLKTMK